MSEPTPPDAPEPTARWVTWLVHQGLGHLVPRLAAEGVADDVIDALTEPDLIGLGLNLGDRKRFMRALADWSPPSDDVPADAGERRQLTILFCDLVDSTALCQSMSPEAWRDTVLHYQRVAAQVLAAYGGTVAQYLGDGLLAYFGFPQAHEDAPVRAVHAALDIVSALAEQPCTVSGQPVTLRVRLGLDTGLVVVGDMGSGNRRERLALGDAPNVAARLQSLAAPGEVLVSAVTWQLVQAHFEGSSHGLHALKGRPAPTEVWQVHRSRDLQHRYDARRQLGWTPMVGRQAELRELCAAWQRATQGRGQAVWVEAEPGMGKSRLVEALREQLALSEGQRWAWQASPQHVQRAFHLATDALTRQAALVRTQPSAAQAARLTAWLHEQGIRDALAPALLCAMMGLPVPPDAPPLPASADARWAATGQVLQALLTAQAARVPLLWVIEDLHWADSLTRDWLLSTLAAVRDWPVLIVLTARPEVSWRPPIAEHIHLMQLRGLAPDEVAGLVAHAARHHALDPVWQSVIAERTDGVPLFVEELARMLAERPGGAPCDALSVPQTLHGLLMARLDQVPRARTVAQAASVIGRAFSREGLLAMLTQAGLGVDVDAALAELQAAGLILQDVAAGGLSGGAGRLVFKHALVQDVAYEAMVHSQRVALHAAWLTVLSQAGQGATEPALLARHADAAGLHEQAVAWWLRASEQALQQLALADAVACLQGGLLAVEQLAPSSGRDRHSLQLHAMLGTVHMLQRGWAAPEVEQAYARAHALAQAADGVEEALWPLWGLCVFRQVRGELDEAVTVGRRMMTVARQSSSRMAWLVTNMMHTQLCLYSGRPAEVPAHVEQVLHRYSDPADRSLMALYSTDLLLVAQVHGLHARWILGEAVALEPACDALVARAQALQHPYSLAWALSWGAMVLLFEGRHDALAERARAALTLAESHGYAYVQAMARFQLGWCAVQRGEAIDGLAAMRDALADFQATGAGIVVPFFQTVLAEALGTQGRIAEGLALVEQALARTAAGGERWHEAEGHRVLAVLRRQAGEPDESVQAALLRAAEVARQQGAVRWAQRSRQNWTEWFSSPLPLAVPP